MPDAELKKYKVMIAAEIEAYSIKGVTNVWIEQGFDAIDPDSASLHVVGEA